jgi:hypothetical protein
MSFDGVDDYVSLPRVVQDDFTIECWVKTTQTAATGHWWRGRGLVDGEVFGIVNDFGTALVGRKFAFGTGNPDITITSIKDINDSIWHHCTATRVKNTGTLKVYVDGALENASLGGTQSLTSPPRLTIGCLQVNLNYFNGLIAEVRIYNRALSASEIQWNYQNFYNPVSDGLVLCFIADPQYIRDIDGDGRLEWIDLSGYNNHGKIYGATLVDLYKAPVRALSSVRTMLVAR